MKWYWWALLALGAAILAGGGAVAYIVSEKLKPYLGLIQSSAQQYGIPWEMMAAEIMQESGGDPNAVNSASGAQGIAQFMPATAAELGIDPMDPNQAIPAMAQYLAQIRDYLNGKLGSYTWGQVLAGYNWGMGNVVKAVNAYGADWLSHAPTETQDYLAIILGNIGQAVA